MEERGSLRDSERETQKERDSERLGLCDSERERERPLARPTHGGASECASEGERQEDSEIVAPAAAITTTTTTPLSFSLSCIVK